MNALVRRVAGFAGVAVLATVTLIGPASGTSANQPFVVVNAASNVPEPVPRGALLMVFAVGRLSMDEDQVFSPWSFETPGGVSVEASCGSEGELTRLPIRSIERRDDGTRIGVYYPNSIGEEPFRPCLNAGPSEFWVHHPFGSMTLPVATVLAHPGIFTVGAIGDAPDGTHTDGATGAVTAIVDCNQRLPADPAACPARTNGQPARLRLSLTGSEAFACEPCTGSRLVFELAPAAGGAFVQQTLASLVTDGTGVEKATIVLRGDTAAGEYLLRVRNTMLPVFPDPLRVEVGQPVGTP